MNLKSNNIDIGRPIRTWNVDITNSGSDSYIIFPENNKLDFSFNLKLGDIINFNSAELTLIVQNIFVENNIVKGFSVNMPDNVMTFNLKSLGIPITLDLDGTFSEEYVLTHQIVYLYYDAMTPSESNKLTQIIGINNSGIKFSDNYVNNHKIDIDYNSNNVTIQDNQTLNDFVSCDILIIDNNYPVNILDAITVDGNRKIIYYSNDILYKLITKNNVTKRYEYGKISKIFKMVSTKTDGTDYEFLDGYEVNDIKVNDIIYFGNTDNINKTVLVTGILNNNIYGIYDSLFVNYQKISNTQLRLINSKSLL